MKVLFYIGNTVSLDTIMKQGILTINNGITITNENSTYNIDNLINVEIVRLQLGTMIKLVSDIGTIYLTVPRIYINIGNGFAVINRRKTCKLAEDLKEYLLR